MGEPEVRPTERAASGAAEAPPSGKRRRRRRARPSSRTKLARARLRKIYFSMAAVWGFLIGTAAVLTGLAALGRPLRLAPALAVLLVVAALVAIVGGLVAATAYRDASNRLR